MTSCSGTDLVTCHQATTQQVRRQEPNECIITPVTKKKERETQKRQLRRNVVIQSPRLPTASQGINKPILSSMVLGRIGTECSNRIVDSSICGSGTMIVIFEMEYRFV